MNILIYAIIFIIGTFFGSFYTLAVYRIPIHENITHKHSFCPNCKNKLQILDLIPVFSYIFLGGKCRHCGQKIRIRYLVLEILSGIFFLITAISIRLNFYNIEILKIVYMFFVALYFTGLIIIAGIDKEKRIIPNSLINYLFIVDIFYMLYLCIVENANMYRYIISIVIIAIFIILKKILNKKIDNYILNIISLILIIVIFNNVFISIMTFSILLVSLVIERCIKVFKKMDNISMKKNEKIALKLCTYNVISVIIINIVVNFILQK